MDNNEFTARIRFISNLGVSLHDCGASSHRVGKHLTKLSKILGIHGDYLIAPTSITCVYWKDDPSDQTIIIKRAHPGGGDLGRLEQLDSLIEQFQSDKLNFQEMSVSLDEVLDRPKFYGQFIGAFSWMVASFFFSTLLSRNSYDACAASFTSLIIFYLLEFCSKRERFDNLTEIIATAISGIILSIIASFDIPINIPFCILSSIIVLIPGLSFSVALNEIASRELLSGTCRFVDAVMSLLKLYLGALIGVGLGSLIFTNADTNTLHSIQNLPTWIIWPALVMLATSITVAFNIHPKFLFWCLLSSIIAFVVSLYGTMYFNQTTGILLGAFAVGIYSNLFANVLNYPASMVLTTGIIFLVPGSKTYIILNTWITGDPMVTGTENATQAFLISISLVGGLLLSNATVPTKKSL